MSEPRPPYVRFEYRQIEDRDATIQAGHYVAKDVIFALVTPTGSKDLLEKPAEEWIKGLEEGVNQERIPSIWLDAYKKALQIWEENQTDPEFGTPIRNWPALTPSQLKMLTDCNLRSVEDVAEMNEEAVLRMGMGGRALKEKARAWLDASKDVGKTSEELDSLRKSNATLAEQNTKMMADMKAMQAKIDALSKDKG